MLPQLPAIPIQTSEASNDASRNINRLFPVGQNVSATVVAVSRDQIQPEIFRLKLEVNNRLIQMGVFQALPVGQKINVNRQSDGQINISPQPTQTSGKADAPTVQSPPPPVREQTQQTSRGNLPSDALLKVQLNTQEPAGRLPLENTIKAAVISSRPIYPQNTPVIPGQQTPVATHTAAPTARVSAPATSANQQPVIQSQPAQQASQATPPSPPVSAGQAAQTSTTSNPVPNIPNSNNAAANTATPATQSAQAASPAGNQAPAGSGGTPPTATAVTTTPPIQAPLATGKPPGQTISALATANTAPVTAEGKTATPPPTSTTQSTPNPASGERTANQASASPQPATNQGQPPARPVGPPIHHIISLALNDGSKVEIQSPRPLPQGAQIQLSRSDSGEIQISRIQNPSLTPSSALERPAVQDALREALPNQIPKADAFSQLSQLAGRTDSPQMAQISGVVRSMLQLFGVQPGAPEAAQQIRQNIELGGLNTERTLSKGLLPPQQDLKTQLQQLDRLTENLPAEQRERMEQLLRGIHSRVTSQQLNSLSQWRELPDGGFERVLQLDLPIKQGDNWENLELRLTREGGTNAAGEMISVWRVRLHFDLEELGGMDAEIRLTDGHEISTLFWCEQPETAEILRSRAEEFSEKLRECGFSHSEVNWHEGSAPEQKQAIHKQIIDLHT